MKSPGPPIDLQKSMSITSKTERKCTIICFMLSISGKSLLIFNIELLQLLSQFNDWLASFVQNHIEFVHESGAMRKYVHSWIMNVNDALTSNRIRKSFVVVTKGRIVSMLAENIRSSNHTDELLGIVNNYRYATN